MINHDTRINPDWTVAQLLDLYDGHTYETKHDHPDRFICDFCAAGVAYSSTPRVAQYVTDRVLNPDHSVWQSKMPWEAPAHATRDLLRGLRRATSLLSV